MNNFFLTLIMFSVLSYGYNPLFWDNKEASTSNQRKVQPIKVIGESKQTPYTNNSQRNKKQTIDVKLGTFTDLPRDIDGCVCFFYLSKLDEKKGKYIFVNNFAKTGYVLLNRKLEKFDLIDYKDKVFYLYSNGVYNLKINFETKKNISEENFSIKGDLTLLKNGSLLIKKNFIGQCGC
ncbi:hypothetical protein [Pedobacter sp. L105]|uniref:hypothetical protein n=1 Tax=Pedobacter sp. L105 TaxID=1641871 RepID=UPI00131D1705|nr:hypothetical protein [Pedobacter sp. L105]